jgi:uncharacterized protein YndB with AHSA1/START domain
VTTQSPEMTAADARTVSHDTIVIERAYDATPSQVFGAFSTKEAKAAWFAVPDETFPEIEFTLDFRVGGRETNLGRLADGSEILYDARFEDIVTDSRIVVAYTMSLDGHRMSTSLQTLEFVQDRDRTRLILTEQIAILDGLDTVAQRRQGIGELLDGLGRALAGIDVEPPATRGALLAPGRMWTSVDGLEFTAIRVFEAPKDLTFRAWSSCEHLSHWWGPTGWTLPVCEMDFRPGGEWFYGMRGPDGEDSFGLATYEQIVESSLIVYTDAFADADRRVDPDMPVMPITVHFTESNGRTTLTSRTRFATAEDVEKVLGTGMIDGLTQTWDRLEAYLAGR